MKGFQFYVVKLFPDLTKIARIENQIQTCILGELEDIPTSISLAQSGKPLGVFQKIKIASKVKRTDTIYVRTIENGRRLDVKYEEYLKDVEFYGYYDEAKKVIFFQSSKKVTKGVLANLKKTEDRIRLAEMVVDFDKVKGICPSFETVWVRNVNSRLKLVTLAGEQIQHDVFYKNISKGAHSGIILSWPYDHVDHPILVTANGSIALVKNYKSPLYELELVSDIYDKLLSKVWREKTPPVRRLPRHR